MEDTFEKGAICRFKLHLVRKWILLPFDRTNRKRRIIAFLSPEDKKIISEVRPRGYHFMVQSDEAGQGLSSWKERISVGAAGGLIGYSGRPMWKRC